MMNSRSIAADYDEAVIDRRWVQKENFSRKQRLCPG
jgi:hypothetical protein